MIHFQFKRRFFYKKRDVDDFYVPPEERGFWGIVIIMIFGGMIIIFQSIWYETWLCLIAINFSLALFTGAVCGGIDSLLVGNVSKVSDELKKWFSNCRGMTINQSPLPHESFVWLFFKLHYIHQNQVEEGMVFRELLDCFVVSLCCTPRNDGYA